MRPCALCPCTYRNLNSSTTAPQSAQAQAAQGGAGGGVVQSYEGGGSCGGASNCALNNPSSPYGLTLLPGNPLEGGNYQAQQPVFHLDADEVVLLAGCSPPPEASRYFSATGQLGSQSASAARLLGTSLWYLTLAPHLLWYTS